MVDTYGAREDEVRAFIGGGWTTCANHEGDLSAMGQAFQLSLKDFCEMPSSRPLTRADMVIVLRDRADIAASATLDEEERYLLADVIASPAHVRGGQTPKLRGNEVGGAWRLCPPRT